MDGIDWMTVAEVVPVTAGVALLGLIGAAPPPAVLVALALLGAHASALRRSTGRSRGCSSATSAACRSG